MVTTHQARSIRLVLTSALTFCTALIGLSMVFAHAQVQTPSSACLGIVTTATINPDSQSVLIAGTTGTAALVSLDGKQLLHLYNFGGGIPDSSDFAVSPDGTQLAALNDDSSATGIIRVWDIRTNHVVYSLADTHDFYPGGELFSADGKILFTGGDHLRAWSLETGKLLRTFGDATSNFAIHSMQFLPDGNLLTGGESGITIWDLQSGKMQRTLALDTVDTRLTKPGGSLAFSPDNGYFAVISGRYAYVVDINAGKVITTIEFTADPNSNATSIIFSPNGKTLVVGTDQGVKLFDPMTGKYLKSFAETDYIYDLAFAPDKTSLLTSSDQKGVRVVRQWGLETGKLLQTYAGDGSHDAGFSSDGKYILAPAGPVWQLLKTSTGQRVGSIGDHTGGLTHIAYSKDGKQIMTVAFIRDGGDGIPSTGSPDFQTDDTVRLWNAQTTAQLMTIFDVNPYGAALSPDARFLAIAGLTVKVYDLQTGQLVSDYAQDQFEDIGTASSVDFSASGQYIVSAGDFAKLWLGPYNPAWKPSLTADWPLMVYAQAPVGQEGAADPESVSQAVFSPDARIILTGTYAGAVRLWDTRQRKLLMNLVGHAGPVTSVAYAPDGKTVLSGSVDQTARLWDVSTGTLLHTLADNSNGVIEVSYSPDGKYGLTVSGDGKARLWDIRTGSLISRLCIPPLS